MTFPSELKVFRDYVHSFYGKDEIYDLGCGIPDIETAIMKYAYRCMTGARVWGGGDSIDRERVRAILESRGFEELNPKGMKLELV